MLAPKHHIIQEMAPEYHFDYKKAKPNRFAQKMNFNLGWTVERFVEIEEEKPAKKRTTVASSPNGRKPAPAKTSSPRGKATPKKKPMTKGKAVAKKRSTPKKAAKSKNKK